MIPCTGLFRPVSSLSSRGQAHQNCWLPSLCLLIWWVFLTFHLGLVSLSLCDTDCCDIHSLSHTDGENHRRANISCISDQSCYDHWCCFIAPGASDQRGKGPVDITGPQLDFALVCVYMHVYVFLRVSRCSNKILLPSFHSSHLNVSVPPYSPVFLDGWQAQAFDETGRPLDDPIESQHKQDALRERRGAQSPQDQARETAKGHGEGTDEV